MFVRNYMYRLNIFLSKLLKECVNFGLSKYFMFISIQSNIAPLLNKAIDNLYKLDILYQKGTTKEKRRIIGSIFPEKLIFDGSRYQTARVNEAIAIILLIDKHLRKIKNWTNPKNLDLSSWVVPPVLSIYMLIYSNLH